MSQIQVPSLLGSRISVPDTTIVSPDQQGVLAGVAAGLGEVTETTQRIVAQQTKIERASKQARIETGYVLGSAKAAEAADLAPPDEAVSVFNEHFDGIFEEVVGEESDPFIRDAALLRNDFLREKGLISVRRNVRQRLAIQFAEDLSTHEDAAIESIETDRLDIADAIEAHAEFIDGVEGILLNPAKVKKNKDDFGNRVVVSKYNSILKMSPQTAIDFLELPIARKFLTPDDIARRTRTARGKVREHNQQIYNSRVELSKQAIRDMIASGDASIDLVVFSELVDTAVDHFRSVPRDPRDVKTTAAQDKTALLEQELLNAAVIGDESSFAAIRGAMPDTSAAIAIRNQADGIFSKVLDDRAKAFDGAARLRVAMVTGDFTDLPRDDDKSLDKFYQQSKEFGVSARNVARFVAQSGVGLPNAFLADLRSWFQPATLELERGIGVLAELGGNQALRLADSFGDIALTAHELTRRLDMTIENDRTRRAEVIELLSGGNAKNELAAAQRELRGNLLTGKKFIPPIVTRDALTGAGIHKDTAIEQSVIDRFDAQFKFAWLKWLAEGGNVQSEDGIADTRDAASAAAAAAIADNNAAIRIEKEQAFLVPQALYNVGTVTNPRPKRMRALITAIKGTRDIPGVLTSVGTFGAIRGSNFNEAVRLDRGVPLGEETFIPVYVNEEITAFVKWNIQTTANEIITRKSFIEGSTEFDFLVDAVNDSTPFEQIAANALLMFNPRSGVKSMQEWDLQHEGTGPNTMVDRFAERAELLFTRRHQKPLNYEDSDDVAEYTRILENMKTRFRWPEWSPPLPDNKTENK